MASNINVSSAGSPHSDQTHDSTNGEVISSPGRKLDDTIRLGLEDRLGTSLDHVQVHTGPSAQQACEQVNARAFAVGNHIAFGPGEYDPGSADGQHLIAHEVVHTLQQPDADISMMPKTQPDLEVDPDPAAEREADEVAERIVEGGDVGIYEMYASDVHVQRAAKGDSMTYEGLDNLTEAVADLRSDLEETKSNVSELRTEVQSGLGETAMGVAGAGAAAGTVALGRAVSEPALQEMLAESAAEPTVAAPAIAAAAMTVGVGAAGEGFSNTLDRLRDRLFGADDDADGKREEADEGDESRLRFWD